MSQLLTKGLEEEVYTGSASGEVVGLSDRISAEMPGFATEPDARNVEFTTAPYRDYDTLLDRLMTKRCQLRRYLEQLGGYSLVPGSTLSLAKRGDFQISNPDNPYYRHIRDSHGTDVVTASTHINLGIEDTEELHRACRVVRADAALFLALTASSPFLEGTATGFHSTRWHLFPETPEHVPFFANQLEYTQWFARQLEIGTMFNARHLWVSVRPNGPDVPEALNRLELRICDRISQPRFLAAVVALAEARIWQVLENPELDPLTSPALDKNRGEDRAARSEHLVKVVRQNEAAAARSSLDADFISWQDGTTRSARSALRHLIESVSPVARAHGFESRLEPLDEVLTNGNLAMKWLARYDAGKSVTDILGEAIQELAEVDWQYDPLCPEVAP